MKFLFDLYKSAELINIDRMSGLINKYCSIAVHGMESFGNANLHFHKFDQMGEIIHSLHLCHFTLIKYLGTSFSNGV